MKRRLAATPSCDHHRRSRLTDTVVAVTAAVVLAGLGGLPAGAAHAASSGVQQAEHKHKHHKQTPKRIREHNKIYRAGVMADVGCAPASQIPLDNVADLTAYHQSVLACLNAAWAAEWPKSLSKHGHKFKPAKLIVHSGDVSSPCGAPEVISYYCGQNHTIYMYAPEVTDYWNTDTNNYDRGLTRLSATHTIAHEFGHHVQQLSGILGTIKHYAGGKERRTELQASCLGNVFLSAQRSAYPILADYFSYPQYWRYITVANHGSTASQAYWTNQGYSTANPKACNDWKAPASAVS